MGFNVNKSSFFGRLKESRSLLGFKSQAEVAEMVGVSREMWGKYERGSAMPGAEVLIKLFRLGFDVGYILTGVRAPVVSDEEMLLLTAWRNSDFLAKHKALDILNRKGDEQDQQEIRRNFEGSFQNIHGHVENLAGRDINFEKKKD